MLFTQAYKYLDKQKSKYEIYTINNEYEFEVDASNITDLSPMKFTLSSANKTILSGSCSFIGIFNSEISMWQWAWSIPFIKKAENYSSRKILQYAFDIDTQDNDIKVHYIKTIYKTELLNSKLYLEYPSIDIERYLAISLYLLKGDYYYKRSIIHYNINTKKNEKIGDYYYILSNVVIH